MGLEHSGPSETGGGAGGPQPPNNLLKFGDFVSKAVKAKAIGMKIQTRTYSRELPESIKNAIFDVIQVLNFKIFMEDSH